MNPSQGRLQGRTAIVTGASSGIGRAISVRYAQEGANVVVADLKDVARSEDESSVSTVELIKSAGGKAMFCKVNVTERESMENAVRAAVEKYGRLDVMVNNAGVGGEIIEPNPVWKTSDEMWEATHAVNSRGVFYGVRAAAAQMVNQEPLPSGDRGWIINLASTYGITAVAGSVSYCASKALVIGLTKSAALDCAPYRVHVNAICPGYTQSALTAPLFSERPEFQKTIEEMHPFRGIGKPDDIAKMAVFLGSDESSWCTGTAYPVDGGFLAQ